MLKKKHEPYGLAQPAVLSYCEAIVPPHNLKPQSDMEVLIHSYFSDMEIDSHNTDCTVAVTVPFEHTNNYKEAIEMVAGIISEVRSGLATKDDLDNVTCPVLPDGFFADHKEDIADAAECSSSILTALDILGWEYRILAVEEFDADYSDFK